MSADPTQLVRQLLQLDESTSLEIIGHDEPPPTPVAHDLAGDRVAEQMGELLARIGREPDFAPSPIGVRFGADVRRWRGDLRVVVVSAGDGTVTGQAGTAQRSDLGWIIDSGCGPGAILIERDGADVAVVVDGGTIHAFHIEDRWTAALAAWSAPALEAFPIPSLEELTAGMPVSDWLEREARRLLESPALMERVAGAGLIGRLGPAAAADPRAALDRVLAGGTHPAENVRAWARSLSAPHVAEIERCALEDAGPLSDAVARLHELAFGVEDEQGSLPDDGAHGAFRLRALARRRDDLESVRFVLVAADGGALLDDALAAIDATARQQQTAFDLVGGEIDDRRLAEIYWQYPEHWWGMHPKGESRF